MSSAMPLQKLATPRVWRDEDAAGVALFRVNLGQAAMFSAVAPDKTTPNEDTVALVPVGQHAAVLLVADGAGGTPAGDQASSLAVTAMIAALGNVEDPEADLRNAILDGVESANQAVLELGGGSLTTLAVVEIREQQIRTYHVGDSMILVTGQRGRIKLQTVSHSPVGYAVEAGFLEEREALHHEDRHLVSNMAGCTDMRIEIGPAVDLAPRDTLVVASDGLFDNLHIDEIVEQVRKGPLGAAAQRLADDATSRMLSPQPDHPSKPDDLSFILYRRP